MPAAKPGKPRPRLPKPVRLPPWVLWPAFIVVILALQVLNRTWSSLDERRRLPYSEFNTLLDSGRIDEVRVGRDRLRGTLRLAPADARDFEVARLEDPSLAARLSKAGTRFEATAESGGIGSWLSPLLPLLFLYILWRAIFRGAGTAANAPVLGMSKSKARVYAETVIPTRFADVAGVDEAKQELAEVIQFLRDPKTYGHLGGRVPKGTLLVGPPGTGKTLLARAVAGEAAVPFYSINGSEFVELFVGLGAARVRDLFEEARAHAPCIIFIDELDALGKARGISVINGGANDEKEQTLNQLLAEIDGFDPSAGVVLLAATNRPEILDPALLRSGRFDRQILIDHPDRKGRANILRVHLRRIKADPTLNIDEIAALTPGLSGADLANLVNEGALIATRQGARHVSAEHLTQAFERVVAGVERKSRIISADERRRIAFHELGHAIMSLSLGGSEKIHKVSIIPRGIGALGYTMRRPIEDRYLWTKRELEIKLAVLTGGRAAEELFLDGASTGSADDLAKATEIARAMVTQYGMTGTLVTAPSLVDQDTNGLLEAARDAAVRTLSGHAPLILSLVDRLLQQETQSERDLRDAWDSFNVPRGKKSQTPETVRLA